LRNPCPKKRGVYDVKGGTTEYCLNTEKSKKVKRAERAVWGIIWGHTRAQLLGTRKRRRNAIKGEKGEGYPDG